MGSNTGVNILRFKCILICNIRVKIVGTPDILTCRQQQVMMSCNVYDCPDRKSLALIYTFLTCRIVVNLCAQSQILGYLSLCLPA
ncbi:MAG: hypothetical protein QG555_1714 [Thermodesulfobacteriota bacterium]|nr:hypothetical protein [Thermodesulfobacteriota bacterium]